MPISRSQMPRQMYGLGSIVKSIGKTVKKVVKSPIGKAAILGLGGAGLMGMGPLSGLGGLGAKMGSLFSGGGAGLGSMFGKAKSFIGANKMLAAGSLGLAALAGAPEEVQETSKRDVGALRQYLSSYYQNLGYSDDQIAENVARDTSEYTSGQGSYAMGGRVNYQDGTPKKGLESISIKDMDKFLIKMPHKIKYDKDGNPIKYPKPKVQPHKIQYDEEGNRKKLPERLLLRNKSAMGGRIGYASGTDFENYLKGKKKFQQQQNLENEYKDYLEDKRRQKVAEQKTMAANGGRIMRALGSDRLVEQASGIEGLDINVNPKGVKELDLRDSGGFIPPVGVKEKADDIPAMLSNNEFVFTADAVRAAGGGSVNKGAQVMYDAMKKLENGGTV